MADENIKELGAAIRELTAALRAYNDARLKPIRKREENENAVFICDDCRYPFAAMQDSADCPRCHKPMRLAAVPRDVHDALCDCAICAAEDAEVAAIDAELAGLLEPEKH